MFQVIILILLVPVILLVYVFFHQLFIKPILRMRQIRYKFMEKVEQLFIPVFGIYKQFEIDYKKHGNAEYSIIKLVDQNPSLQCIISNRINRLVYVFIDPSLIKEVLLNPQNYSKIYFGQILRISEEGLIFSSEKDHRKKRALYGTSFNFDSLKGKFEIIKQICQEVYRDVECDDKEFVEFNGLVNMEHITSEVIGRTFFGKKFSKRLIKGIPIIDELQKIINEGFIENKTNKIIMIKFMILGAKKALNMFLTKKEEEIKSRIADMRQEILKIIDERIIKNQLKIKSSVTKNISLNNDNKQQDKKDTGKAQAEELLEGIQSIQSKQQDNEDFLDIFIKSLLKGETTKDDIVAEFVTLFFAGSDTNAVLTTMILYYLAKYPDIKEKLLQEVNSVIKDNEHFEHSDLRKMPYMEGVMNETLRFSTPASATFPRIAQNDHQIGEFQIKKGDFVAPYFSGNFLNEKYFDRPKEFRPERWIEKDKEKKYNDPFVFIPFSSGPRNCIGQHLALIEVKVMIGMFLKNFDLQLNEEVPLRVKKELLRMPDDGRLIKIIRRNKQQN